MISLHKIYPYIDPTLLNAARRLARDYPRIAFDLREGRLWYRLRPTDAWVTLNDIGYWAETSPHSREPEADTRARFVA